MSKSGCLTRAYAVLQKVEQLKQRSQLFLDPSDSDDDCEGGPRGCGANEPTAATGRPRKTKCAAEGRKKTVEKRGKVTLLKKGVKCQPRNGKQNLNQSKEAHGSGGSAGCSLMASHSESALSSPSQDPLSSLRNGRGGLSTKMSGTLPGGGTQERRVRRAAGDVSGWTCADIPYNTSLDLCNDSSAEGTSVSDSCANDLCAEEILCDGQPQSTLLAPESRCSSGVSGKDANSGTRGNDSTKGLIHTYKELEKFRCNNMREGDEKDELECDVVGAVKTSDKKVLSPSGLVSYGTTSSPSVRISKTSLKEVYIPSRTSDDALRTMSRDIPVDATITISQSDGERSSSDVQVDTPLLRYIADFMSLSSKELGECLNSVKDLNKDLHAQYLDWLTLTAILNTKEVIQCIVVPLLLELLSQEAAMQDLSVVENTSNLTSIICALIGLGERAAAAVPHLVSLLRTQINCPGLVALAIRVVGGSEGTRELCMLARKGCSVEKGGVRNEPHVWAGVVRGIGAMAQPVGGHTTILCLPNLERRRSGRRNGITFYRAPTPEDAEEAGSNNPSRRGQSLKAQLEYDPTHVLMDTDLVLHKLLPFFTPGKVQSGLRYHTSLLVAFRDFTRIFPAVWEKRMRSPIPDALEVTAQHYANEIWGLPAPAQPHLPNSYDPYYVDLNDELFTIEDALVTVLFDRSTPPLVLEQTLTTLGSLPEFAVVHVADPVVEFISQFSTRFLKQRQQGSDVGWFGIGNPEDVVVTGLSVMGRLARNAKTPQSVVERACELLLENIAASSPRVRGAACVGLGELGVASNKTNVVISTLVECLNNASVDPKTVTRSLSRMGLRGVRLLLGGVLGRVVLSSSGTDDSVQEAGDDSEEGSGGNILPTPVRIACAQALPKADVLVVRSKGCEEMQSTREEVVQQLAAFIVSDDVNENLVLECVYALAELLQKGSSDLSKENNLHYEEAFTCHLSDEPSEAFDVLKTLTEVADLSCAVLKALFFSVCAFGGQHGELYASQTAIQHPSAVSRVAAVFGLRACGAKAIRTIALALNDDDAGVRKEAFESVDAVGVFEVIKVLRTRPRSHIRQVTAALRDSLLRDVGRSVDRKAAQELYTKLIRE
uniref:Uncharacterized protein TCIL3000_11_12470 n=1 Tax=Trypanosoma congolense (strain IL3000) TaxID=1068625 RepID=G0V279_TRYCI|nr:unnamed protein product [Trypanosoma congolense IL3000]